jgi:hypothetical protein
MLVGLRLDVTPPGRLEAARATVPAKPPRLETVTVDVMLDPGEKCTLAGFAFV